MRAGGVTFGGKDGIQIGYARVSTAGQDSASQRDALLRLGVLDSNIYVDDGLTGTNRARPGLREALAAVRLGDTLVVTKLGRLTQSVRDARDIADELTAKSIALSRGGSRYQDRGEYSQTEVAALFSTRTASVAGTAPVAVAFLLVAASPGIITILVAAASPGIITILVAAVLTGIVAAVLTPIAFAHIAATGIIAARRLPLVAAVTGGWIRFPEGRTRTMSRDN